MDGKDIIIYDFGDYKKISESWEICEKALSEDKIGSIKRFIDAGDLKTAYIKFDTFISDLKNLVSSITYNDIILEKNYDYIEVHFVSKVEIEFSILEIMLRDYGTKFKNKIFGETEEEVDLHLNLTLDKNNFNRLDIISEGLPMFLKGIGLGKKIYKKVVKDYGYMSSINGFNPSKESSMTWLSLARDKDVYTFTKDEHIICIWGSTKYEDIVKLLKGFLKNGNLIQIDDDFLNKYELTQTEFIDSLI